MIIFSKIKWKNLLSTGNHFTEIDFLKSPATIIVGVNGSGKSTLLDALCFVLFGKPFRRVNKNGIINSINNKDCVVEIEFTIGSKSYKIIRGIKPNIFEIYENGTLIDQSSKSRDYQEELEKNILKLNFKSFTQIVILGSATFTPFMQLKTSDRREIIEDLLDIQIFSAMNELLKSKISDMKNDTLKLKYDIELTSEKVQMQRQNIDDHKRNSQLEIDKKKEEIQGYISQTEKLITDIRLIQKHIDVLQYGISDADRAQIKSKKLLQIETKAESNIKKIKKDIEFYTVNDTCPTCTQELSISFKHQQLSERNTKLQTLNSGLNEIQTEIERTSNRLSEIYDVQQDISKHNSEIIKLNSSLVSINKYVTKLNTEIAELSEKKENMGKDDGRLNQLKADLDVLIDRQEELSVDRHYYNFASNLLKDTGIKTRIIRQYLPIINKLINKYLVVMDSFINFNLDESFEETIKSRHRDDFSYHNFSEGEKMKIDLSLLLTWRQVAKLKNSNNTNLLIMDEIFDSSLDSNSVDLLMGLLKEVSSDTNVFVISHKTDQLIDKFENVIKFKKINNFSEIE